MLFRSISGTVTTSFSAPSTKACGVEWDGTNLLSADYTSGTIYKHSGFSSTVTSSFSSPSTGLRGIGYDGANLTSSDYATALIYTHTGFSANITSSFAPGNGNYLTGIADDSWSGSGGEPEPPATALKDLIMMGIIPFAR